MEELDCLSTIASGRIEMEAAVLHGPCRCHRFTRAVIRGRGIHRRRWVALGRRSYFASRVAVNTICIL
jgi:hypothetical protein